MQKLTLLLAGAVLGCVVAGNYAQAQSHSITIFIQATQGFDTSLAAAMVKKHVPATVVADEDKAEYTLKAGPVDSKDESGAGKVARCLFLDCIGMNGNSEVSVQLVRNKDSAIVWAYQVRKANSGPLGVQSMSEAVAKHLKNDYLNKHREQTGDDFHP